MQDHLQHLYEMLSKVEGYIYPNEIELQWGILIVLYPYLTGLVAALSGGKQIHVTGHGADGWELGARLAQEALTQGAGEILAHA